MQQGKKKKIKQVSWSKNIFCEFREKKFEWKEMLIVKKQSGVNSENVEKKCIKS